MTTKAVSVAAMLLVALSSAVSAQWIKIALPETPRTANGEPDMAAPAPKAADGKPDLSGIWQVLRPFEALAGSGRAGLRRLVPEDFEVPLQPWAKILRSKRDLEDLGAGRPSERCLPHAVPDALFFSPFKVVQTPRLTVFLLEEFNYFRQIHLDGRGHPVDPEPAWFGYSVGSWDGDALVVNTRGFKIGSWLDNGWLDDSGIPYSGSLHTSERYRRLSFGRLHLDVTIDDPSVFTRSWTFPVDFQLQADTELIEDICENERDVTHMKESR